MSTQPRASSTNAQRLTAVAAVVAALTAIAILVSMWAFIQAFSTSLDNDHGEDAVLEYVCTGYVSDVLDLGAQGYTARQITDTYLAARDYDTTEDSYLVDGCGTPKQILDNAGAVKK